MWHSSVCNSTPPQGLCPAAGKINRCVKKAKWQGNDVTAVPLVCVSLHLRKETLGGCWSRSGTLPDVQGGRSARYCLRDAGSRHEIPGSETKGITAAQHSSWLLFAVVPWPPPRGHVPGPRRHCSWAAGDTELWKVSVMVIQCGSL